MKMSSLQLCCFLLISLILLIYVSSDHVYYESFDETYEGSWTGYEKEGYSGKWKRGFLVSKKAIVNVLKNPVFLNDGTVVLEFKVCLQTGLRCGDAYIDYLRPQEASWTANEFDNESPYCFMFGPDKCGTTNKVHFFIKHQNPKSGEYVEHHLNFPVFVPSYKFTHVFTILKPDNEVQILVDGEEKKNANLLSSGDSEPALIPGKWHAPLIENLAYKGIWKPQEIPNPDYFAPISATRIEISTMQAKLGRLCKCRDGYCVKQQMKIFRIQIRHEFKKIKRKVQEKFRDTTWKPKFKIEEENQKGIQKNFDVLYEIANLIFSGEPKIKGLIERA